MKIHTTQNLELLNSKISTNKPELKTNYALSATMGNRISAMNHSDSYEHSVSFKGKKPKNVENAKKVIDMAKKGLEDIKDKATPEVQKGDSFLKSSFFNACLKLTNNEPVFQAVTAAIICILLRPLTIMALPTKDAKPKDKVEVVEKTPSNIETDKVDDKIATPFENKDSKNKENTAFKGNSVSFKGKQKEHSVTKTNNMYASAQSISSGIAGVISAAIISIPTKNGSDRVLKNLHEFLTADNIKKLYPWVDKNSIIGKNEKLLPMDEWKNVDGLKFISDLSGCEKLPEFKKLTEVSKETFKKILGVDIDFISQKGKSFNDVKLKDGRSLYEAIPFNKLGIKVKEEGFGDSQILLRDLNKDYLEKLIADSKGVNEWGNLDINSVYADKSVKDFRHWKDVEGKDWKLDLDSIGVCSELETANYRPRISGEKRFDKADQEWKFMAHQANGIDGKLGTKITNKMVEADANNTGLIKCLTWLPDITFRIPIAVGTIALIPWVLKNVFHLEKVKPNTEQQNNSVKENAVENVESKECEKASFKGKNNNLTNNNVSFKGKTPDSKKASWLTNFLAKHYGKPLLESDKMRSFSKWLTKVPGDTTEHMAVLGSLIQSSVYVNRTLSNKDLDNDRKKTLAINQGLCFVIPTIAGYTVNNALDDAVKKVGYRYNGLMNQKIANLKNSGNEEAAKQAEKIAKGLGKKMKGVRTLAKLASFTLIYRYLSPVLVTPVANKLGDKFFSKKNDEQKVA